MRKKHIDLHASGREQGSSCMKTEMDWQFQWNFPISPTLNFTKIHLIVQVVLRVLTDRFDRRCAGLGNAPRNSRSPNWPGTETTFFFLRYRWLFKCFIRDFLHILLTNRRKTPPRILSIYAKFSRNTMLASHLTANDIVSTFNSDCNLILVQNSRILYAIS